jgi:hypothetical protein
VLSTVILLTAAGCYAPRGSFDSAAGVTASSTGVWVSGWVDDQDATGPSVVKITLDGVLRSYTFASTDRPDVAAFVPAAKVRSGFNIFVPAAFGLHQACVWAVNTGGEEADAFLGCKTVAVGRGATTSYSFMATSNGTPVKWNACQDVHYTTRTSTAYSGALADVQAALAQVSAYTGLHFVYDGEVSTVPTVSYGQTGGPLLIGFVDAAESDLYTGAPLSVVGIAGSWYNSPGTTYHSGRVALERTRLLALPRTGPASRTVVIMHELGHAIGLGHIADVTQIMNPVVVSYADWGAGDMTGLQALSTPVCPAQLYAEQPPVGDLVSTPLVFD